MYIPFDPNSLHKLSGILGMFTGMRVNAVGCIEIQTEKNGHFLKNNFSLHTLQTHFSNFIKIHLFTLKF